MKSGKIYIIIVVMIIISTYILVAQEKRVNEEYCIIKGENVSIRQNPSTKSKVIGRLDKYEFVYCTDKTGDKDKIGEDEDYWYKISNCDTKEGWVFGKNVNYIDGVKEPEKYFKRIIEIELIDTNFCKPEYRCKIFKLNKEHDHYIIDFEAKQKLEYVNYGIMGGRWTAFYKIIDDHLTETIHTNGCKYCFYKNYIIIYTDKAIRVYNTKKFVESVGKSHFNIPCKYYESTGFYLNEDVIDHIPECNTEDWRVGIKCISYSDMEFNPETMEVIVNIRIEKDKLLKQEKYKFKDGKFVKVE